MNCFPHFSSSLFFALEFSSKSCSFGKTVFLSSFKLTVLLVSLCKSCLKLILIVVATHSLNPTPTIHCVISLVDLLRFFSFGCGLMTIFLSSNSIRNCSNLDNCHVKHMKIYWNVYFDVELRLDTWKLLWVPLHRHTHETKYTISFGLKRRKSGLVVWLAL